MSRRGDERAVTIQIGAVLLLAILVAVLSLYQVNAVPDQNYEREFAHGQEVRGELVELRDAIRTTGFDRTERGVPVSVGLQYDTRAVAINPPNPSGRIATTDPRPVTFSNASANDPVVQDVIDAPLETRLLVYEPGYNEYDAPTTVLEHTLLYDEFGHANVTREDQRLLDGDRLTLVLVDGDLSRTSAGTVSVSVEPLAGPTRETPLRGDGDENATITLPTEAPERWEESLGTDFGDESGHPGARVVRTGDRENVTIELAGEEPFRLRLAQVSVGDGAAKSGPVANASTGVTERPSTPAPGGESGSLELEWGADAATMRAGDTESFEVTASYAGDPVADATVDFSRLGGDALRIESADDETADDGRATVTVTAREAGDPSLLASTAGHTAQLPVTVEEFEPPADEPYVDVAIADTNSPVAAGETLDVETTVENRGVAGTDTVVLETADGTERDSETVDLEAGESTTVVLEWTTVDGDAGEHEVAVSSADDEDRLEIEVTDAEDGDGGTTIPIDDFERDEPIGWGSYYGDTTAFETTTDAATSGSRSLYGDADGGTAVLLSGSGLGHEPERGDVMRFDVRPDHPNADASYLFGGWDESNAYGVRIDAANDRLELYRDGRSDDGGIELASDDVAFDRNTWYDVAVDWGAERSDTIAVTVRDETGAELGTVEAVDGTYDDGIVGFVVDGTNRGVYVDDWRAIVRNDGA